jgi:hypothetical protein
MEHQNKQVRFKLPDYVSITREEFDGADVTVEYDSNFNGHNETVTVQGEATLDEGCHAREWTTLNIDGKEIRCNGHVFSASERHLGTVESVTVTVDKETAVDMVTEDVEADVDDGGDEVIVQTWDNSVMDEQGFMAGTDEVRMKKVV